MADNVPVSPFAVQCLHAHNEYRKLHGSPSLRLDPKLVDYAQKWANELARTNRLQHNPARRYGENVYACRGFEPTAQQAVRTWYDENKHYSFEQSQFSPEIGHFTAVVWSGSRLLGVGYAHSDDTDRTYVVANYDPPGNVIGYFEKNVQRPFSRAASEKPLVSGREMGEQCLRAHNDYRRLHGAPELRLDDELSAHAQKHANLLATENRLQHNPEKRYGENIFSCSGFEPTGQQIVKAWYDEVKLYRFDEARFNPNSGHFTAVVWLGSQRIGVGLARSETTGQIYVVVNYDPPGNVSGQFQHNVLQIGKKPKPPLSVENFAEQCLQAHNEFRTRHSAPALRLDRKMCEHAQKWADEMATTNQMMHNPDRRYGENVYSCRGFQPTGRQAVVAWYDGIKDYDFGKSQFVPAAGHFTSIVWYASRLLGIGRAENSVTGKVYIVANYDPPGNVVGRFAQNVLRAGGSAPTTPYQTVEEFAAQCVQAHNELRKEHSAPPLHLDPAISAHAQSWANELAQSNNVRPNPDRRYGENIYSSVGVEPSASAVVQKWYNEGDQYDFEKASFSANTGHFTSVVWQSTHGIGVGLARNAETGRTCIVVNYDPAGNVNGLFKRNVLPKGTQPAPNQQAAFIVLPTGEFEEQCLMVHNMLRKRHGASALRLDNELSENAQNWANQLAKDDRMYHNPKQRYGENIFTCRGYDPTGEQVTLAWYDEIKDYDFDKAQFTPDTGHFTAIVWCNTQRLGIGMARSSITGQLYVVANYDPPGNVQGQFADNVLHEVGANANQDKDIQKLMKITSNVTAVPEECKTPTTIPKSTPPDQSIIVEKITPATTAIPTKVPIISDILKTVVTPSSDSKLVEAAREEKVPTKALTFAGFAEECLLAHNAYRLEHGAPALQLDPKISEFAQNWANELAQSNEFRHNTDRRYGENVYTCSGKEPSGAEVAGHWYSEIKDYSFDLSEFTPVTGHFTALVWCASRMLGIGIARSKSGETYVVANYDPAGNIIGRFAQNVLKKGSKVMSAAVNPLTNATTSSPINEFAAAFLQAHNKYRQKHSAPDLKLDKTVTDYAQKWANELAKTGELRTNPNRRYGENLFAFSKIEMSAEDVVHEWYDKIKNYNFEKSEFVPDAGNFSGLVWYDTRLLGVGVKKSPKTGMVYVVANYDPRGNISGQFADNVLREGAQPPARRTNEPPSIEEFAAQCLQAHNKYRSKHSAPPLELDAAMCEHSQKWANHLSEIGKLDSNPDDRYGETIFWSSGVLTADKIVENWYKEIKNYDFSAAQLSDASYHFTSLVWCNTRRLGVGIAFNKTTRGITVVVNYDPPGNRNGLFDRNVLREGATPIPAQSTIAILTPEFAQRCLVVTNEYRQKHGAPPFVLDDEISEYAQKWAHVNAREDRMYHNPEHRYGENLYTSTGFDPTADRAVFAWYDEIRLYSFEKPGFSLATGHFTALIWCGSQRMGVGMARNGTTGKLYLVCNYLPAGNVQGQFETNVLREVVKKK